MLKIKGTPAFAFTYDEDGKYTDNPTGTSQIYRIYFAEGLRGTVTSCDVEFCGYYYAVTGTQVTKGVTYINDGYDYEETLVTTYTFGTEDVVIGKDQVYQWKGTIAKKNATWEFDKNNTLTISDGNIPNYNTGETSWYRFKDKIVYIIIGEDVTSIVNYAFYGLLNLSNITGNNASVNANDRVFDFGEYCQINLSQSAKIPVKDSDGCTIHQLGDKIFIDKKTDYDVTLKFDLGEGKHLRRIKLANEYYYADSEGKVTFNVPNKNWTAYLEEFPTITELNFASGAYQISSAEDLKALAAYVNAGNTCEGLKFKLTADIPMTGVTDFAGIGDSTHAFKGTFDGGNFTIGNLNISGADYVGLVGNNAGTIKNLTLDKCTISSANYGYCRQKRRHD